MLSSNVLCVKKRKKRYYCVSNISDELPPLKNDRSRKLGSNLEPKSSIHVGGGNRAMMQITEDTPPDMLAGAMDLTVHLPNAGQSPIKISVNRSTPMMDLLVQVTTAHRLQPSAHIIQAIGYSSHQSGDAIILPYKPNTPIGALDTKLIKIIPKSPSKYSINNNINNKLSNCTPSNVLTSAGIGNRGTLTRTTDQLPFESTFRLQVHLPRNQLYVARVSQFVTLENIMKKVCTEKNLDEKKYEFRHPVNFHEVLDSKLTLSDYQITEVTVVKKGKAVSASDMATLQREEERRRQQARNGGGVFNLIFKRGKSGMGSGSVSSDTRSISPTRSDSSQSRSITPPAIQHSTPKIIENKHENEKEFSKPKPPLRKRRPAPKPPTTSTVVNNNTENIEKSSTTQITTVNECTEKIIEENNSTPLTICHSRNSSDSSGYHEASILSDTFNVQTLPRKNKTLTSSTNSINYGGGTLPTHFEEKNKSNMSAMGNHSKSTSNLSLAGQKKKRAPPPPPIKSSVSVTNLSTPTSSVVVSAKAVESSPATTTTITNITESISSQQLSPAPCVSPISIPSSVVSTLDKKSKEISITSNETSAKIDRKEPTAVIAIHPVELPPQFTEPLSINTSEETNSVEIKSDEFNSGDAEWQYQLPSPPTAFRDTSPTNFTEVTNYDTITLNGLPSPKLLDEKSTTDSSSCSQEQRSETTTIVTESEKILPEYTEIATPPQEFSDIKHFSVETLEQRKSQVLDKQLASLKLESPVNNPKVKLRNELEEVIQNAPKVSKQPKVRQQEITTQTDFNTLPNFKLTTYDQPKRVINIFEDDSVRSNVDTKMTEKKSPITDLADNSVSVVKRSSGISERDMNIMNSLQNNNDFKKPIVVDIKKKPIEKTSKSIENLYEKSNGLQRADSFHISESNMGINETSNPVKRSKSHVSLNKYKLFNGGGNTIPINDVTSSSPRKTSSQWDISDLQSLQVMRTILPKIQNSQPNSPEEEKPVEIIKDISKKVNVPDVVIRKPYQYSPPAVNLSTWSERPKSQVSLKSDNDYKIGGVNISTFEKRSNENDQGNSESKTPTSQTTRFINHTTAVGFKRPEPFSKTLPRPHSIAFDTYQDLSRVPIVRAVELKKTFRDNLENKSSDIRSQTLGRQNFHRSTESVNQELKLCPIDDKIEASRSRDNLENHVELRSQTLGRNVKNAYRASEPNSLENKGDTNRNEISNNVLRNINKFSVNESCNTFNFTRNSNSFLVNRNTNLMPVVKGFRSLTPAVTTNSADLNSKSKSQNQSEKYTTNCIPVNMSQPDLEPKFTITVNGINQNFKNPVPPPPMPKVTGVTKKVTKIIPNEDPRDQLLNAIRNFGKDSLKPVRY